MRGGGGDGVMISGRAFEGQGNEGTEITGGSYSLITLFRTGEIKAPSTSIYDYAGTRRTEETQKLHFYECPMQKTNSA